MVDQDVPQEMADGMFEVFAVRSSFHIAQLQVDDCSLCKGTTFRLHCSCALFAVHSVFIQVGLSAPIRIGQGRKASIKVIKGPLPMQCDGEAWQQHPSTVSVSHRGTSLVLAKKHEPPRKGYF